MLQENAQSPPAPAGQDGRWWSATFALAAVVFLLTAQRGPAWQDSGIFQWRIRHLDLTGFLGLALAHPLLIVLGKAASLVPLGSEVWRMNALCALAAAAATANLALLLRRLAPGAPAAAALSAGAFALAHTVWWLATITESHALLAALMSAELLALVALLRRPGTPMVVLLGLLNGLGASTHNLALLALPAYGTAVVLLAARGRLPRRAVGLFVLAWAVGASLLIGLVARSAGQVGLAEAVRSALFGRAWQRDVLVGSARAVGLGCGFILYNFPNLAVPLAGLGLWRLRRRFGTALAAALGYILLAHLVFALRYPVPDQFMFFVPAYLLVALLAGLGLASLSAPRRRRWQVAAMASLALGPVLYAVTPRLVHRMNIHLPGSARKLPYRDNARYWLTPWKHDENSAGRFARAALGQLQAAGQPAVLIADNTSYWPLRWVAEVEGLGRNVRLLGRHQGALLKELSTSPEVVLPRLESEGVEVYVVSNVRGYCPPALLGYVQPQPTGVLYRVRPRGVPTSAPGPGPAPAGARG